MKTINKLLVVTLIMIMVGLGCISAADNSTTATPVSADTSISEDIQAPSESIQTTQKTVEKSVQTDNAKEVKKATTTSKAISENINTTKTTNKNIKSDKSTTNKNLTSNNDKKETKQALEITITQKEHGMYFRYNNETQLTESTNLITAGSTIILSGEFRNVNFTIDKPNITLKGENNKVRLYNCTVTVAGLNSENATVENLRINNSNTYGTGIYINVTKNVTIRNNVAFVNGPFGFALAADKMNNSLIEGNTLETACRADTIRTHTAAAFGSCYFNNIRNNKVTSDAANGIYFSVYGSGLFQGGYCDDNNVTGNRVLGGNTSWSYSIQIMGTRNIISNNTVNHAYRGISTQDFTNNTITRNYVNATSQGIYACEGAIVTYNEVHVNDTTTGIEIGGNGVLVKNNNISSNAGSCIVINANDAIIENNYLWSTESYAIYSKGQYKNIIIRNNTMTAQKMGILFRRQSTTKRINNVLVSRNAIQSFGECAIDFSDAGAYNPDDINITVDESNVLNCSLGMGRDKAYIPPSTANEDDMPESNKTYIVTDDTYYSYFNDDFSVNTKKVLKNDTIILKGTFKNKKFIFPIKVHVIGQNCIINDGTLTLTEDASNSTVTNITIRNTRTDNIANTHAIEVKDVSNCKIINNTVYNFDNWESIGIWLYGANGATVVNNKVFTSGDYINYAVTVYATDMSNITNNTITVNQSSKRLEYDDEIMLNGEMGTIKELLHAYGIILLYSSRNTIEDNTVIGISEFKEYTAPETDCKNSVVGIDIYYDSNYNLVQSNNITMTSFGPYTYGMGVLGSQWGGSLESNNATNNSFYKNTVTVNGGYFATGFISGLNSVNTIVEDNVFNVNALHNKTQYGDYVYGCTLEASQFNYINNNVFNLTGAAVYSVEIFDSINNSINGNDIYAKGSYIYGIAGYRANDNNITSNKFDLRNGSYGKVSEAKHSDAIRYGNAGIYFETNSFRNNISYNTINTTAQYTANLTYQAVNNTIEQNALQANKLFGDESVLNDHKTNVIRNNFLHFTTLSIKPIKATVGAPFTVNGVVTATTNDLTNLTVSVRVGGSNLGTVKVNKDGTFALKVNLTSYFKPTKFYLVGSVSGTNFQNTTTIAILDLNKTKTDSIVKVTQVSALPGENVTFIVDVEDYFGSKLSGEVTIKLDEKEITTENLTLGRATYKYKVPMNTKNGIYNITVIYSGNDDHLASEGSSKLCILTTTATTVSSSTGAIGDKVPITGKVTSNGKAVNKGTVTITVNNQKVGTASVKNGIFTYNYTIPSTFTRGSYTIKAQYNENEELATSMATNKLNLVLKPTVLNYNTTYATVGQNTTIKVGINDNTGKLFAKSGIVTISINGVQLKYANGSAIEAGIKGQSGYVIFTFNAPASLVGSNNISFTFKANNQFNTASKTFTNGLIIYAAQPTITVNNYAQLVSAIKNLKTQKNLNPNGIATIKLNKGNYNITEPITWNGATIKTLRIIGNNNLLDGNKNKQFITVDKGYTLELLNFKIQRTNAQRGSVIYNKGTVNIYDSIFLNNTAKSNGGVIYNDQGKLKVLNSSFSNNIAENGAIVYNNNGTINLTKGYFSFNTASRGGVTYDMGNSIIANSIFKNNNAKVNGGANFNDKNTMTITNSNFTNNKAGNYGGAMYNNNYAKMNITSSNLNNNYAPNGGVTANYGTIIIRSSNLNNNNASRGGVNYNFRELQIIKSTFKNNKVTTNAAVTYNDKGTVTITDSTFESNKATGNGGVNYSNNGKITITNSKHNKNTASRGGVNYDFGTMTIDKSTFTQNTATINGGCNFNDKNTMTITNSNFTNNKAGNYGGCNYNNNKLNMNITGSLFTGNYAPNGGVNANYGTMIIRSSNLNNNNASRGGVNYNFRDLQIIKSTFKNNKVTTNAAVTYNDKGTVTITDSTFESNKATGNGGVNYNNNGKMTITNSKNIKNTATRGGVNYNFGTMTIDKSTFTQNTATMNGGVNFNDKGTLTIKNCNSTSNTAQRAANTYNNVNGILKTENLKSQNEKSTLNPENILNFGKRL